MNLTAGKVLQNGKYVLNEVLSQGGFGITYKATQTYLSQIVVIKTLNENLRRQEDFDRFQAQFIAEAQRLAKCQHPNIVRVLDFFEEGGHLFLVMDYIPGPTLAELIKKGQPLPEAQAIHYIRQVGAALSVVHQNGLLHRDVKPQNIIRREGTETVILIDFGIAREFTLGVTQTQTGMLSAGYAPLEQYLPRGRRGPATDIYALAATLYYALTGQPPVAAALRDRIPLQKPRELVTTITPTTELAILHGLAIEAPQRPQTVEEWLALLPVIPFVPKSHPIPQLKPSVPTMDATVTMLPESYAAVPSVVPLVQPSIPIPNLSQRWGWRILGITAAIAAMVGVGFGIAIRMGDRDLKLLQREQSFPPTDNWPAAIPTSPAISTEKLTPEPTAQTDRPTNSQPRQSTVQPDTNAVPRRSRTKRLRSYQREQTPPSASAAKSNTTTEPTPSATPSTPNVLGETQQPHQSPMTTPSSTPTPVATSAPPSASSPPPIPVKSEPTAAAEPSNSQLPANIQLLPKAPAPVAAPTETPASGQ